jgi:isocitrate dehydrogenase kinase/phosphatase
MTKRKQYKRTNNDLQNIHIKLNIALYQRPVTDIRGQLYNSIADGIIVQVKSWYTYTLYQRHVTDIRGPFYNSIADGIIVQVKSWYTYTLYQRPVTDIRGRLYNSIAGGIIVQIKITRETISQV